MPIKISEMVFSDAPRNVPRFFCDACGAVIEEASLGLVVVDPGPTPQYFHKGDCDPGAPGWHELAAFIVFLGEFAKIDWEHASQQAVFTDEPWLRRVIPREQ